jgi:hypothetical protein
MNPIWDEKKPIEFFFPRLVTVDAVATALREEFGDRTPAIITKLKERQPLADDELGAHDTIVDLVDNESKGVKTFRDRRRESEEYPRIYITIMRFGPGKGHSVYWIQGMEGESDGYFESMQIAKRYVDLMFA